LNEGAAVLRACRDKKLMVSFPKTKAEVLEHSLSPKKSLKERVPRKLL